MSWIIGALLGLLGAVVMDGSAIAARMTSVKSMPWRGKRERKPVLLAILIRAIAAAAVAGVLVADGKVGSPLPALLVGVAAPEILQRASAIVVSTLFPGAEIGTTVEQRAGGEPNA